MEYKMFCYQCQETAGCTGCTQSGVCGKKPEVAAMQDLLVYVTKGLAAAATQLRAEGKEVSRAVNQMVIEKLGGLPDVKIHCSVLAEEALHAAIADYKAKHGK